MSFLNFLESVILFATVLMTLRTRKCNTEHVAKRHMFGVKYTKVVEFFKRRLKSLPNFIRKSQEIQ